MLFVYRLFVRLVRKSKKKQTVVAILNKLAVFFFCGQVISIFFIRNLGKPMILCIIPWKTLENSKKYPRKPLKTLEFELKVWLATKLKSDFHRPKILFYLLQSSLKMMKNAFYFILKAVFVLKIFKFLC